MGHYLGDRLDRESVQKAVSYFEQVIELEPGYAQAWVGLGVSRSAQASLARRCHPDSPDALSSIGGNGGVDDFRADGASHSIVNSNFVPPMACGRIHSSRDGIGLRRPFDHNQAWEQTAEHDE